MQTLLQDLRYAIRMLFKNPGFTAVAVLTLALGIGANTAIFSLVHGVLLRPLPYPEPDALLSIWQRIPSAGYPRSGLSQGQFLALRDTNQSFEYVGAYFNGFANLTTEGGAERILVSRASQGTFEALRVKPILGRLFRREEELSANANVAILSYGFWQRHFHGRESVLGEIVRLGDLDRAFTVIGVLPADFRLPTDLRTAESVQLWLPAQLNPADINWGSYYLVNVVGRRKPGVTVTQAHAEVEAVLAGVRQPHEERLIEHGDLFVHVAPLQEDIVGGASRALWVLFAAVGLILLIACGNLANLLLARGAARQKEIAVRTALGADRVRLARQLLTESALLALAGGLAGIIIAWWCTSGLAALNPGNVPRLGEVTLSAEILAFTLGVSLLAAVLFGLMPALQATRLDLNRSLREEGHGLTAGGSRARLRRLLVMAEVALAAVVVVSAGLLVRTLDNLLAIHPGFRAENLLAVEVSLPQSQYREAPRVATFYNEILERIRALPGVTAAAAASRTPLAGFGSDTVFDIEGRPTAAERLRGGEGGSLPHAGYRQVTPGYLEAMGIPLIAGRSFRESDTAGSSLVVMINQTAADRLWPGESPIGQRVRFYRTVEEAGPWAEIVGIFGDTRVNQLNETAKEEVLMVHAQGLATGGWTANTSTLVIRTAGDPRPLSSAVREEARALDANVPVFNVRTFEQIVSQTLAQPRFNAFLLASFATLAMVLAAVGIYGVLASSVAQRRHEIGIRLALGAQRSDILRLVLRQGLRLTFAGLAAGLVAALAATQLTVSLLYGVTPHDPLTFAAVAGLFIAVALLACWVPARRAAKVDPMVALRFE